MHADDALPYLKQAEVLYGLTMADLELFCEGCEEVEFCAGEVLLQEGQKGTALYIVCEGELEVLLPEKVSGSEVTRSDSIKLNILRQGECCGEYSIIEDMPVSASVVGVGQGRLLKLDGEQFKNILALDDRISRVVYRNMLRTLVGRLKRQEGRHDLLFLRGRSLEEGPA